MWNPEARDSSPIIFTFMSSWDRTKMPPLPGRRGTRRSLWKRATAGLDEVSVFSCGAITQVRIPLPHFFAWKLDTEPWVSLWSNHFGEESTPPLVWTEGNKMPPPRRLEGGEQGVPERPNPLRRRSSLRSSGSTRNYAASPDGYQLGNDPAISRPLY
jgi:hypothetical protein